MGVEFMVQHLSHDHECISMSLENPEIFNKVCATLVPSNHQCPLYTHIVGYIHVYVASRLTAFEMLTWQKVGMPSKHLEKCTWVWSCLVVLYISYPKVPSKSLLLLMLPLWVSVDRENVYNSAPWQLNSEPNTCTFPPKTTIMLLCHMSHIMSHIGHVTPE